MGKKAPRERFFTAKDEVISEPSLSRSPTPQLIGKRKRSKSRDEGGKLTKKLKSSEANISDQDLSRGQCQLCGRSFNRPQDLRSYRRCCNDSSIKKTSKQLVPKRSPSPFNPRSKANLASRRKSTTPNFGDVRVYWMCWLCGEPQHSSEKLEKHQKKPHEHLCQESGCLEKAFTSKSDLLKHNFWAHNLKKQIQFCDACQEPVDAKSWSGHCKNPHSHRCPDCDLKFTSEQILWYHRVLKHSGQLQNERDSHVLGCVDEQTKNPLAKTEDETEVEVSIVSNIHRAVVDDEEVLSSNEEYDLKNFHAMSKASIISGQCSLPTNFEEISDLNSKVNDCKAFVFTPDDSILSVTPEDVALYGPDSEESSLTTDIDLKPHNLSGSISKKVAKFTECSKCVLLVPSKKHRNHELKQHKFTCVLTDCSRSFLQQRELDKHVFRDHSLRLDQEKYNACSACGELFTRDEEKSFLNHQKFGKHYSCVHCEDVFRDPEQYEFHLYVQHSEETDLKCFLCGLRFVSSDHGRLKRHEEKQHRFGPCQHCQQTFVSTDHYRKHHDHHHFSENCNCLKDLEKLTMNAQKKNEYNPASEDSYDLVANTTVQLDSSVESVEHDQEEEMRLKVGHKKLIETPIYDSEGGCYLEPMSDVDKKVLPDFPFHKLSEDYRTGSDTEDESKLREDRRYIREQPQHEENVSGPNKFKPMNDPLTEDLQLGDPGINELRELEGQYNFHVKHDKDIDNGDKEVFAQTLSPPLHVKTEPSGSKQDIKEPLLFIKNGKKVTSQPFRKRRPSKPKNEKERNNLRQDALAEKVKVKDELMFLEQTAVRDVHDDAESKEDTQAEATQSGFGRPSRKKPKKIRKNSGEIKNMLTEAAPKPINAGLNETIGNVIETSTINTVQIRFEVSDNPLDVAEKYEDLESKVNYVTKEKEKMLDSFDKKLEDICVETPDENTEPVSFDKDNLDQKQKQIKNLESVTNVKEDMSDLFGTEHEEVTYNSSKSKTENRVNLESHEEVDLDLGGALDQLESQFEEEQKMGILTEMSSNISNPYVDEEQKLGPEEGSKDEETLDQKKYLLEKQNVTPHPPVLKQVKKASTSMTLDLFDEQDVEKPSQRPSSPSTSKKTLSELFGEDEVMENDQYKPFHGLTTEENVDLVILTSKTIEDISQSKEEYLRTPRPEFANNYNDNKDDDIDDLLGDSDDETEKKSVREPLPKPFVHNPKGSSKKKPPSFQCPECEQSFGKNEGKYKAHKNMDHPFKCRFCHLKFTFSNGLEDHENAEHFREKKIDENQSFKCNQCLKGFNRKGSYERHLNSNHVHPCDFCDLVFVNSHELETHVEDSHKKVGHSQKRHKGEKKGRFEKSSCKSIKGKAREKSKKTEEDKSRSEIFKKREKDREWKMNSKEKDKREKDKDKSRMTTDSKNRHQKGKIQDSSAFMAALDSITIMKSSKKSKLKKRSNTLTEDDGRCEMCGQLFQETEVFMRHIETDHDHQCQEDSCGLSFTHEYYLHLHESEVHKTRPAPNASLRPEEEKAQSPNSPLIANKSLNDSSVFESTVDFSSTFEESLNAFSAQYKCDDCTEAFSTSRELYVHRKESHYTFEQASSSQAYLPSLACTFPQCSEVFENGEKLKKHFSKVHEVKKEKVKRSSTYHLRCSLCRKTLSSENKLLEHQKIEHKYKCDQCPRSYILNPDLLHHILKYHDKIESDSFTCRHCDQKFSEERIWRQHEASPHDHSCTKEECFRSFCDRRQLEIHLSQEHDVLYVTIDHILGTKGVITTQKNAASEDIAGWAEEWIRSGHNIQLTEFKRYNVSKTSFSCFSSPMAVERMKNVMRGKTKSRRHELFLDKRERERCSGNETSRLYQLSNPGYLGGGGEKDTIVIKQLIETVFVKYFSHADPKLKKLGHKIAFVYTSCVLFPETFIHQLEVIHNQPNFYTKLSSRLDVSKEQRGGGAILHGGSRGSRGASGAQPGDPGDDPEEQESQRGGG